MSYLEVRDLVVAYGAIQAVRGVSFEVEKGQIVSLIGSNGAGKTTTLRTISGLLRAVSGEVLLDGEPIHRLPAHEILAKGVAHSPEGRKLFSRMTVEENLEMGAFLRRDDIRPTMEQVYDLFPILREKRRQPAGELSGGQRQQVAVGRALMTRPKVLMLDEPVEGLAPIIVEEIVAQIRLIRDAGVPILLVEQNLAVCSQLADRHYILELGRIVHCATAEQFRSDPDTIDRYLGVKAA